MAIKLRSWKFILIIFLAGILLRFVNLDQKVYSADEVRSILRLSGYTSQEFIDKVFTGDAIDARSIINEYQQPNPERTIVDAVKALSGNPEHPPLYHLLTRFWMQLFQYPLSARIVSIIISIFIFPAVYWLCLELFDCSLTGKVAMVLMAISPFQILISQNTTQYSLWAVTILLSSAALLRAIKLQEKSSWWTYITTLIVGFYTHLLFVIVVFGQSLYVLLLERFRMSKILKTYVLSLLTSLVFFSPWIILFLANLNKVKQNTAYYRQSQASPYQIFATFKYNLGHVFVDLYHQKGKTENILHILIIALVIYSIYFLIRHTSFRVWSFLLLLIIVMPIVQITPDLLGESVRSLQARYYLPCFLGIQISVAFLIANFLNSAKSWKRIYSYLLLLILILLGTTSGIILSQAQTAGLDDQWGTASGNNSKLAPIINQAKTPLVISEATHSFILALAHLVDDKVQFQLVKERDLELWRKKIDLTAAKDKYGDVFILYPDKEFLNFLQNYGNSPIDIAEAESLYKVNPVK